MKRAFSRYAHLTTLIADTDKGPLDVFDSSVTDDKAITTANFPSAALVHLALDTAEHGSCRCAILAGTGHIENE